MARPTLFIANSDLEAKKVYNELRFYTKDKVEYLGTDEIYFYHLDAKDRSEEAKKLRVLLKLAKKQKTIVVTSVDAILRKYIPKKVLLDNKKNSRGIYSSTIYLCVPSMGNNLTVKVRCGLGSGNC